LTDENSKESLGGLESYSLIREIENCCYKAMLEIQGDEAIWHSKWLARCVL